MKFSDSLQFHDGTIWSARIVLTYHEVIDAGNTDFEKKKVGGGA